MGVKTHFIWIEPMQGCFMVTAEQYQKFVDLKIWADPLELVVVSKHRPALRVRQLDPFVPVYRRVIHLLRRLDAYWDSIRLNSDVFDDDIREVLEIIERLVCCGYLYLLEQDLH